MSLDVRLLRASAPLSLQLLRELQRGRLLGRSGLPLPAPLPRLLLPAHHSTLCDVMSREVSGDRSFSRSSRVSRSSDRGTRKDCRARSRSDSSRDRGRRSRSRSAYCSRLSGRECRRWSSSRSRSSDRSCSRRVRSRSRGDRSRSSD